LSKSVSVGRDSLEKDGFESGANREPPTTSHSNLPKSINDVIEKLAPFPNQPARFEPRINPISAPETAPVQQFSKSFALRNKGHLVFTFTCVEEEMLLVGERPPTNPFHIGAMLVRFKTT
jgi:hypothetical protein